MNQILRRIATALATAAVAVAAILNTPVPWFRPACIALAVMTGTELALLLRRKVGAGIAQKAAVAAVYGFLIALAFATLPKVVEFHGRVMLLYVVSIVKVSDMGGFAFGLGSLRLFGRNHKLCPKVSPNKSWEGLFGSVFASCVVSLAFMSVTGFAVPKSIAFGVVAAFVGTLGDLVESMLKRWVGVKDSATFMPAGLGGLLDMFDSLLLAPALMLPFI